ncbi:hypothetical protein VIN7_8866 [Saccharomyces cerevisiae x Saccharomyces kudriavzevii VIN7]|uniref:Uncharacterized protein n=1 Tax=Saccharomyces cerevisiae x Saccharomyces kudriavzevii (strain VIN7) TaxID=1095631 RepID=H0GYN3_SACCK|nr:hypothetical protein VIN7_8866 [Saccharomyces cerevisiae x Saccharomyces kudriavzevii VIN7]
MVLPCFQRLQKTPQRRKNGAIIDRTVTSHGRNGANMGSTSIKQQNNTSHQEMVRVAAGGSWKIEEYNNANENNGHAGSECGQRAGVAPHEFNGVDSDGGYHGHKYRYGHRWRWR